MSEATVIIGADLCPIEGNRRHFIEGDAGSLFHDLLPEFRGADLVVANLECPLIERPTPIRKTGPTFGEPGDCIRGIQQAGIHVLGLANNHIMDHGAPGLRHTLEVCRRAGIETVGAGENRAAARRIVVHRVGELRIGLVAMAEHEFSIATSESAGANPLDVIDFVRNVAAHRSEFDYLIALVHGGAEFHVPSPRLQDTCRFLVEQGANAVIVQHPHCLGGFENHQGGHIVYGQGALVMDEAIYRERASFHEGYLVKLRIASGVPATLEIVPFVQSSPVPGARRLVGEAGTRFRSELDRRCAEVVDRERVQARWLEFCETHRHGYLSALLGHGRVLRRLNRFGHLEQWCYRGRALLGARNVVACETHKEAIDTIFRRMLG